jgi:putative phosphoesterase
MKIGLLGDTHDAIAPFEGVRDRVAEAFQGAELILHCGDLTTTGVLDALELIAPVVAVRSASDPPAAPPRLVDGPLVLELGGLSVGLVNTLGDAGPEELFGRAVDVVVHGGTHEASIVESAKLLSVNPGSPTLADAVTVAVLDIEAPRATATIVAVA